MGWEDGIPVTAGVPLAQAVQPALEPWQTGLPVTESANVARPAAGAIESIQAGWQGSVPGLAWRGKLPELYQDPATSKWWERALTGITQVGAELPLMVAGSAVGAPAGAAAGAAITGPAAPAGAAIGGVLGAGAGMFAVPAAIRETLMQAYKSGDISTAADFWNAVRDVATTTVKEGAIGAVTFGAGGLAARAAGTALVPAIGSAISVPTAIKAIGGADVAAQIATMTAMPAALQGRLPDAQEFMDAAIVIGGLKTAHVLAGKLSDVYAKTGKTPAEQVADAQADPSIADDLVRERSAEQTKTSSGIPVKLDKLIYEAEFLGRGGIPYAPDIKGLVREIKAAGPLQGDLLANVERMDTLATRLEGKTETVVSPETGKAEIKVTAPEPLTEGERTELADLRTKIAAGMHDREVSRGTSMQSIYTDVYNKMVEAGRPSDEATAIATIERERYGARAERIGVYPAELYFSRPLDIRGPGSPDVPPAPKPEVPLPPPPTPEPTDMVEGLFGPQPRQVYLPEEPPPEAPTFEPKTGEMFGVPRHVVENLPIVSLPVEGLAISRDVPQFKSGANERGVVEPLGGKWDPTGVGPIQVWERSDGRMEVISGRHRLDMVQREKVPEIAAQIHREADGFTADQAAMLDAMLNIRDGQGSISDYANIFRFNPGISYTDADAAGLLARSKGRSGFAIARNASDDVFAAHSAGLLSDSAAEAIAVAAPNNPRLQALGLKLVFDGKSHLTAVNTMKALEVMAGERLAAGAQGDIFGFDDSAMRQAAEMSERASKMQRQIAEQIRAVQGAARRPDLARKMGVDVQDPESILRRVEELKQEQELWDNWPLHPELVARVREQTLAQKLPDFALEGETAGELKARDEEAAAQAKRAALEETKAEREKQGQKLTVDQADLFNTQGSLFQRKPEIDKTKTPEFEKWFGASKVVDAKGEPLVLFHGTKRLDRMGPKINPRRATSGPMPYFTDDPKIASNYANNKADTSLLREDVHDYSHWFRIKMTGMRNAVDLERAWWTLSPEEKSRISNLAPKVTRNDAGDIVVEEGNTRGIGNYDYEVAQRGSNPLKALVEGWLNGGVLYGDETAFMHVLKAAGVDVSKVEMHDPWAEYPGVLPAYLSMQNPLRTDAVPEQVLEQLAQAVKRTRRKSNQTGDTWDKDRQSPKEWVDQLKSDISEGKNSFVWTSIPDRITAELKTLGYDGIIDTGGKSGGAEHSVYIPFSPEQIKSAIGNRGTFDSNNPNILKQERQGAAPGTDQLRGAYTPAENLVELFKAADKSSALHEIGHSWLEELKADATRPDASPQLRADWETVRRELAIPENGQIGVASHEQWARSVERYVSDGKAPSLELQGVFARFREWLLTLWRQIRETPIEVSPDLREVLDRMLATDQQIKDAQNLGVPRAYVDAAKVELARKIVPGFKAEQLSMEPYADEMPEGPGKAPDTSRVNVRYVNGPDDLKLMITRMAELDQANIQEHRGGKEGVLTWKQEQAEMEQHIADVLGGSPSNYGLLRGLNPSDPKVNIILRMMNQAMVKTAQESARLRDVVLEAGHDATVRQQLEYMGAVERARMLHAEFLGERAAVARAMNALKDVTEGSGEIARMVEAIGVGAERLYQRTPAEENAFLKAKLDEIMLKYIGKKKDANGKTVYVGTVLDIAKMHKEIGTLKGTFKLAKSVEESTTWEKLVEGWKSALLSGPVTHVTNLFGTGAFQVLRPLVDATAAGIGIMRGAKVGMGESDRASMREGVARMTGYLGGMQDGVKVGYHTFMLDGATGKTESYRNAIEGRKGDIIRIPLRAMAAEDAMVNTMYTRGELRTLAIRQAFAENLDPRTREFAERTQHLLDNPTPEMQVAAETAATRMTFNAELGEKGRALQLFVNKWDLQWMIPFIRTPINIAKELARMSPLAPMVGEWRAAIAKGGVERDRAIAEVMLGSALMSLAASWAFAGNLSGAGSPDPGKNKAKVGVWQPYSVLIGDTWYEYARIQPMGTLIGLAADMAGVWDKMNDEEKDKVPKMIAVSFANSVTNQTFLQGITNFVNAISDPGRFGPQFMKQFAGTMVPNIIGQPTTMADPFVRKTNSMLEAIQARIPGAREKLLPARDWLGEPVETNERLGGISPIRETTVSDDKVRTEAARLDIAVASAPKKTHIGKGTGKLGDVELTPEEQDKFAESGGKMAHSILTNVVNAPGWDEIPDLIKRQIYRNILTASHRFAAAMALPADKKLAYIQSITERMQQELQPEQQ